MSSYVRQMLLIFLNDLKKISNVNYVSCCNDKDRMLMN